MSSDKMDELRQALAALIVAAEELVSSDPDMPSHKQTEADFEQAMADAKRALA